MLNILNISLPRDSRWKSRRIEGDGVDQNSPTKVGWGVVAHVALTIPISSIGVAPPEEDEGFDFEQTIRDIHTELADLNKEAAELAAKIQENFEELGA
ncbi:MAG: hypothetical protein QME90_07830 [Thermodesulfobacteriota bacterium]|nr:hypothetical protein [Thermodesulfobacteriota bacterium]